MSRSLSIRSALLALVLVALVAGTVGGALAAQEHEGTNVLVFEPVANSSAPNAAGEGTIEYKGGSEPRSKWTATFEFTGLASNTNYTVAVQGRFGNDGSGEARRFTALCEFRSDDNGAGGCWWYFRGLRRLNVSQLRLGDDRGKEVLQATRAEDGPGSITTRSS